MFYTSYSAEENLNTESITNLSAEATDELLNILTKYKMEKYYMFLKDFQINMDSLKYIKETDLRDIFGDNIGARIQFRALVNEWRESNKLDPIETCCCHHKLGVENRSIMKTMPSTSSAIPCETPLTPSNNNGYIFNIDKFLETDVGNILKQKYEENKTFESCDRELLASNIVREHLQKNVPMTNKIFTEISEEIARKFVNENKEYYFEKKPKARGKLYNKYRAMLSRYKNSGYFTARLRNIKGKSPASASETSYHIQSTEEIVGNSCEEKEWLKTRDFPWETVELKWKNTYDLRRQEILTNSSKILVDWPLFTHGNGSRLVNIDFELLFPEQSGNLFYTWSSIEEKVVNACHKNVKFAPALRILQNLSTNSELRHYEIFKVFQAIIKPQARKTLGKHQWKVSIEDAWNSFAVEANSVAGIPLLINRRKQFCISRKITFQPFLIILKGNSYDNPQFSLVTDDINYLFNNFLQALDTYFKIFFVLNLEYPFENVKFWQFVQAYFYKIEAENFIFDEYNKFIDLLED